MQASVIKFIPNVSYKLMVCIQSMTSVVVSRVTFPILFHHANSAYELVVLWHNACSINRRNAFYKD